MDRYPWRNTSEDIADGSPSQWETPGGAQQKADKAQQNSKEYTDEKNQQFDEHIADTKIHVTEAKKTEWDSKAPSSIVTDLTNHIADVVKHVTQAEHDKLTGVAPGAEVNQNTFSSINDVIASLKTDALTLFGGTGITITTNPATKRITITATGDATPGAHGSSHDIGGSDPIPDLTNAVNTANAAGEKATDALAVAQAAQVTADAAETPIGAQEKVDVVNNALVAHEAEKVHLGEVHGLRATDGRLEYFDGEVWRNSTYAKAIIYGVKIDTTNSNPATALTYIDNSVGFTPAAGNNGAFNAGSWADKFPFNAIKPCLLLNGAVNYYLNPNNYAQKADGTASDITSGAAGDVMIEFPKIYWKFEKAGNDLFVRYSDTKVDSTYKCLAHMRGITEKDKCYISAYLGFNLTSKLRSLSGKAPTASQTIGAFRTLAQANGAGYDQMAYYQALMLRVLYIVMFKNRDSQTALGRGFVDGNTAVIATGGANAKGMFYGETTGKLQNKFCGIEDFYGNLYYWTDGFFSNAEWHMLIANQSFNDTGSGYTDYGQGATADLSGYISDVQGGTETGFMVRATVGSATTHYADTGSFQASRVLGYGSAFASIDTGGAFQIQTAAVVTTGGNTGARLIAL